MSSLTGKTIFITGGNAGIGLATARLFAQNGANVALFARRKDKNEQAIRLIEQDGGAAIAFTGDVANESDVQSAIRDTVDHFGGLHYAFNNAGLDQVDTPLVDQTVDDFDRLMSINAKGAWLCMREQAPQIEQSGGGCIVNCSSGAGHVGVPFVTIYAGSKWAINGMTQSVALEYAARGVRVNVVSPGVIRTDMLDDYLEGNPDPAFVDGLIARHPMARFGTPDEVARAVLYLCRDATFTTGHLHVVDGGYVVP